MQELDVVGVRIEMPTNAPVLVLREQIEPHRVMTLYIGGPEASAIHAALEGIEPPRPLTHDLCIAIIENFGSDIEKDNENEIIDEFKDFIENVSPEDFFD